jgi:hypothetical protein
MASDLISGRIRLREGSRLRPAEADKPAEEVLTNPRVESRAANTRHIFYSTCDSTKGIT